jgi:hypothetical protein
LVLDDIRWFVDDQGRGRYEGGFGPEQIGFIRKDLSLIPEDQLVVLMMHIPLPGVADRKEVYDMIAKRPFSMSISAHTHYQEHIFIKSEDGFTGPKPHHHVVNVTVCGSWWRGAPDERGIPHATMRDGAPNGYSIVTFNGEEYAIEYRPAGRPPDYQMNIYLPEEIEATSAAETEVLVNVFAGSEKSKVELRVGATNDWIPMARVPLEDPAYAATKAREDQLLATILARRQDAGKELQTPFIPLPEVIKSPHIWRAKLPGNLKPGSVLVEVRETDMFGKVHDAKRSVTLK